MADNYLITGYWGEPHVTAENDRGINAATFGAGRFVLPVGQQFRAEYIGNNTIRMYDGKLMDNGAAAGIPVGRYVDLLIAEAGQGMNRHDLIVFQYAKNTSTLVESGIFTVVRGTETTGTATDPALTQADLLSDEATVDQMALWRVPVSSAVISAPVQLFEVADSISSARNKVFVASSNDGITYTADVNGVTDLYNGLSITIVPAVASASTAPKLDINGLGAKTIRRRISGNTALTVAGSSDDWLAKNKPIIVTYNGTFWLTDNIKPNANDLYGYTPITGGGTGADTLKGAQANLQIAPAVESDNYPGCYYRTVSGETEWLNPPMVAGTEYRTTERFLGKPVYTQLITIDSFPNAGTKMIKLPDTITSHSARNIVSVGGIAVSSAATGEVRPVPGCEYNTTAAGSDIVNIQIKANNLQLIATADMSMYSGYVTIKYTHS